MRTGQSRGAFSLIELLVVIIIIALVIAIAVPSLFGARNAARASSTQGLMTTINGAVAQFEKDKRRLPGYFTAREMGSADNADRGFSAGENIMLELAGGAIGNSAPTGVQFAAGPAAGTHEVTVDPQQIGIGEQYFVPPPKFYVTQPEGGQLNDGSQNPSPTGVDQLPDVVDAWGTPLLFWVKDDTAVRPIDPAQQSFLCAKDSGPIGNPNQTNSARYYWASNAAFLAASSVGKKALDQNFQATEVCSMIGGGNGNPGIADPGAPSLEAVLGSPNFPYRTTGPVMTPQAGGARAAEGRSSFVIHSAGTNGYYVGSKERAGQLYQPLGNSNNTKLLYGWSQENLAAAAPNNKHLDRNGKPTNIDIMKDSDDLIATGSN